MKTFNAEKKQFYIDRAITHREADEIVQGLYWEDGKGCCVGCLAHANKNAHEALEEQTGIPEWLSRVADTLHEGLPEEEYREWPEQFIKAMPKEATHKDLLYKVKAPFIVFVLESSLENFDHNKNPDVKSAIDNCINLWKRDDIDTSKWQADAYAARSAAESAVWSADSAAGAAAYTARAAAWSAAVSAAVSAAWSVESAARSAESAARSAVESAARSAESAAYIKFRDKLTELLEAVNNKRGE